MAVSAPHLTKASPAQSARQVPFVQGDITFKSCQVGKEELNSVSTAHNQRRLPVAATHSPPWDIGLGLGPSWLGGLKVSRFTGPRVAHPCNHQLQLSEPSA